MFYSEHKCSCHLMKSQLASRRLVAPKKAQNAHGGVYDCRPSLKVKSCRCSAMKQHSDLLLFLLQLLAIYNSASRLQKTRQKYSRRWCKNQRIYTFWKQHGRLTWVGLLVHVLDNNNLKHHLLPFLCVKWLIFCTCTVITKWLHFFSLSNQTAV